MWRKYYEKATRYKMLAEYYRSRDANKYSNYSQKYSDNLKTFVKAYEEEMDVPTQQARTGRVRFLHASSKAYNRAVDLYLNGRLAIRNLAFGQLTSYLTLPIGNYQVEIYPAGRRDQRVLYLRMTVRPGLNYTAVIRDERARDGYQPVVQILVDEPAPSRGKAKLRVAHFSDNASSVDIAVKGGAILFTNVKFTEVTRYLAMPPGRYNLEVRKTRTNQVIYTIPAVDFRADQVFTAYAIGLVNETPPFRVLLASDR